MDGRAKPSVGLDFGTSTSLIASRRGVLPIGDSSSWLPSLVGVTEQATIVVGDETSELADENVIRSIKRAITEHRYYVRFDTAFGMRDVRTDDLIVALLRELARRSEARAPGLLGQGGLTLGCPAMWDGRQRRKLVELAQVAGLPIGLADLVDEPVAAGIAWLAGRTLSPGHAPIRLVVFDMGGGTLDIAVLEVRGSGQVLVLAAVGVPQAGDALDEAIAEDLDLALAAEGVDIDSLPHPRRARTLLRGYARDAKVELSRETKVPISLPKALFGISTMWYSRDQLNAVFAAQLDEAEQYLAVALRIAELTEGSSYAMGAALESLAEKVTHVVLSGGMSQIPYVSERLRALFPDTTAIDVATAEPEEAVVTGLARVGEHHRISMYRPAFDVVLEWSGGRETLYEAYTPLFDSAQLVAGGRGVGHTRGGLPLPPSGKAKLRVVAPAGDRVRATLGARGLDRFPVELNGSGLEFSIFCDGRLELVDGAGTHRGQIDDWR